MTATPTAFLLLCAAALLPACACTPATSGPLTLTTLAKDAYGLSQEPCREVVRDGTAWAQRWRAVAAAGEAPAVDFAGEMVLVACLGGRRTGGHAIEIVEATLGGGELVVLVRETAPAPGVLTPQVLTAPFHAVRVARSDWPVRWVAAR